MLYKDRIDAHLYLKIVNIRDVTLIHRLSDACVMIYIIYTYKFLLYQ